MFHREEIEFKTNDNLFLRGWFYSPINITEKSPIIIMTNGFSALKEHYLQPFAEHFVRENGCVLIYDHRHFGASDGLPRLEVNPEEQINDMQTAITFAQTLAKVDGERVGLWGTSFSGGHVLMVAARDKRVKSLVAQVPFVCGHHDALQKTHPERFATLQKKYTMDHALRSQGKPPIMTNVVTNDPKQSAIMKTKSAYEFFTSISEWPNEVTLRSIEYSGNYRPIDVITEIDAIPKLFIVADDDTICLTADALKAYEKASPPKELVMVSGDHFSAYQTQFSIAVNAASEWFKKTL